MPSIRVGFLGLSKSGWAPNAHLPYLKASPNYEIVALCNSSVKSAQEAIKQYGLPSTVKAYGNAEQLANDPDIDLVVCSVRVDRHLATIGPSLRAGKDVFVEWPLGKSAKDARELLRLKNEGKVKTGVVGLQGRQAPVVKKLKKLIEGGNIGKVLSSSWSGAAGALGGSSSESYEYLGRREIGANLVTIHFGHSIDYIQAVLGYGFKSSNTLFANRRPNITLLSDDGNIIEQNHLKTSDDTIFLQGTLSSDIPLSYSLRGGPRFKNIPGLDWRIYGETGEIRITATGLFLNVGYSDLKVEVHNFENDTVEEVAMDRDEIDEIGELRARNVARIYRELENGVINCTFEDAVARHEFIESLYKENGYVEEAK